MKTTESSVVSGSLGRSLSAILGMNRPVVVLVALSVVVSFGYIAGKDAAANANQKDRYEFREAY